MDETETRRVNALNAADEPFNTVEDRQWTYKEVAAVKRVKVQTVQEWVKRGMVPSPVYTGFTARFTPEQVAVILQGTSQPGTYPVTPSPRSDIGKLGGSSKRPAKGKARNPAQKVKDLKPKPKPKPVSPRHRSGGSNTPKPIAKPKGAWGNGLAKNRRSQ